MHKKHELQTSKYLIKNVYQELPFLYFPSYTIGDKKRRDVVQCIVHVPKYDFYIIASQKGIICQWSSKVQLCADHSTLNFYSLTLIHLIAAAVLIYECQNYAWASFQHPTEQQQLSPTDVLPLSLVVKCCS